MSENFLKFKRKHDRAKALMTLLIAAASGMLLAGILMVLYKLSLIDFGPTIAVFAGILASLVSGVISFLLLRKSAFFVAKEIDKRFKLEERVETMLEYKESSGEMYDRQRLDTENALSGVSLKNYKFSGLKYCVIASLVGAAVLTASVFVPNKRDYVPPEEIIPFELSEIQRAGINELIGYVESSAMEEPYKTDISKELKRLLSELEVAETQPQMQALLAETMAYILKHTSDSSSMTEIANELWDAKDTHTQSLAKLINTSSWREPDWSDYAEKYTEFRALYENAKGEGEEAVPEETAYANLKWMLESSSLKIKNALSSSGIDENDALYKIIGSLAFSDGSENGNEAFGFEVIVKKSQHLGYSECGALLANTFEYMSEKIYAVIAQQKVNTNVGEHAMTKLSTLFLVPLPGFERPDFVKNGDLGVSDSGGKDTDDNNENQSQGGGIGTGATYGSNDLVLDPLTGEYVEYGTLLAKYYSIMSAKLESGNYSEQQKDAIIKYFNLLYGGMKKDEDK